MSEPEEIEISPGIPAGETGAVAALYWEAFGPKLSPALGDRDAGIRYLETQLSAERVICAHRAGRVVGVLGFYGAGSGAVGFSYRELARQYSPASAPWRTLLLAVLGRRPKPGELLLDGLSVAAEARGHGIGSRLLAAAMAEAARQGKSAVRLSVVDSNPRARALYARMGFVPAETVSLGVFGRLFGFQRATDMVFRLSEGAE